ncbi:MAG TPA: hypothetical protein EYQ24_10420 [Bacteroidetes bacterium]|nr:hypothetical protein [Bacteroidota bacterium]
MPTEAGPVRVRTRRFDVPRPVFEVAVFEWGTGWHVVWTSAEVGDHLTAYLVAAERIEAWVRDRLDEWSREDQPARAA